MRPQVFVTRRIPQSGLDRIAAACDLKVWPDPLPPPPEVLAREVARCDGLLTLLTDRIDAPMIEAATRLKVISNFAVGYNNIDVAAASKKGIKVGNTPDVLTEATADIAVTLMLAAARRLVEAVEDAKAGKWHTWEPLGWLGQELRGRTLGIVGMGRIGLATARRLHFGWGMPVIYTARSPKPEAERELGATRVEFAELLARADFVSVHADLNAQSKGMFGREQFRAMKPSAVFVNTARGGHVDQAALAEALREGLIFAAGLDVTDPEPLPEGHELYGLRNLTVAPHIASATLPTRDAIALLAADNLLAGLRGDKMPSCVNP